MKSLWYASLKEFDLVAQQFFPTTVHGLTMSGSDLGEPDNDWSDSENWHTPAPESFINSASSRPAGLRVTPIASQIGPGLKSPSSPDFLQANILPRPHAPRTLTRSKTLPKVFNDDAVSDLKYPELHELAVEPDVVTKIRRWILALVIGTVISCSVLCCSWFDIIRKSTSTWIWDQ